MKRIVITVLLASFGLACGAQNAKIMAGENKANGVRNQEVLKKLPEPGKDVDGISAFNYAIGVALTHDIPGDVDAQTYRDTYADYLKQGYNLGMQHKEELLAGDSRLAIKELEKMENKYETDARIYLNSGLALWDHFRFPLFNIEEVNHAVVHVLGILHEIPDNISEDDMYATFNSLERWTEKWEDYSQQEIDRMMNDILPLYKFGAYPGANTTDAKAYVYSAAVMCARGLSFTDPLIYERDYARYLRQGYEIGLRYQEQIAAGDYTGFKKETEQSEFSEDAMYCIDCGMYLAGYHCKYRLEQVKQADRIISQTLTMKQQVAADSDSTRNMEYFQKWVNSWKEYFQKENERKWNPGDKYDEFLAQYNADSSNPAYFERKVISDSDEDNYNPIVKGYSVLELPWESEDEPDYPHIQLTRKDVGTTLSLDGVDFQLVRFNKGFTIKLAAADEEKIYHWRIYLVRDGKIFRPSNCGYRVYHDDPSFPEKKFYVGCGVDSIWLYSPPHETSTEYYIVD